jgi:hypothetical protein
MKPNIQGVTKASLVLAISALQSIAQTNPNFDQVSANVQGAIHLRWLSTPGEVYQIQYTDSFIDTNTGATTWKLLYDDYPSQGTNTFWLDTGNYLKVPPVPHPSRSPTRFYRVLDIGPDTTPDEPTVAILSPTNGVVTSGEATITVSATTEQATVSTKLYVDGQEMRTPVATTNWTDASGLTNYTLTTYQINTCEWPNGTHILFATATALSAPGGGPLGSPPVLEGHGVSPFVTVTFNNLISQISFSQPFFQPVLGQTQTVSAVFAANVNWTLTVRDAYSNAVRNATGSGTSMAFSWNGTGDGGTNLPAGVYYYYVSAQTNGQAFSGTSADFTQFSVVDDTTELWAIPADALGDAAPLALYPPGSDTNNLIIFEATTPSQGIRPHPSATAPSLADYAGPSSESAPPAPTSGSAAPMVGSPGTFAVGWQTYSANGSNGFTPQLPIATPGTQQRVQMENQTRPPTFYPLRGASAEALNFARDLFGASWLPAATKPDDDLKIDDLRGPSSPFNQADIAFLPYTLRLWNHGRPYGARWTEADVLSHSRWQ